MICRTCGKENYDGTAFCVYCGSKAAEQDGSFCTNCGAKLEGGAFCTNCGAQQSAPTYAAPYEQTMPAYAPNMPRRFEMTPDRSASRPEMYRRLPEEKPKAVHSAFIKAPSMSTRPSVGVELGEPVPNQEPAPFVAPVLPETPAEPVEPVMPAEPVVPVEPVVPAVPAAPAAEEDPSLRWVEETLRTISVRQPEEEFHPKEFSLEDYGAGETFCADEPTLPVDVPMPEPMPAPMPAPMPEPMPASVPEPAPEPIPEPATAVDPIPVLKMVYCTECGAKIPAISQACSVCGAPQNCAEDEVLAPTPSEPVVAAPATIPSAVNMPRKEKSAKNKKLIIVLICVFGVLTVLAAAFFAVPAIAGKSWPEIFGVQTQKEDDSEYDDSGVCGRELEWGFKEEEGELIIFGQNKMTNYTTEEDNLAPWYEYADQIKTVTIGKDTTSIGDYAFYDCDKLEKVVYEGTEAQWQQIVCGQGNEALTNAQISFAADEVTAAAEPKEETAQQTGEQVEGTEENNEET